MLEFDLHFHRSLVQPGESGNSLITVLVATACAGILAVVLSTMFSNSTHASNRLDLDVQKSAIARSLTESLSCAHTFDPVKNPGFPGVGCATGSLVTLLSSDTTPKVLVSGNPASPTTIGKWTVRALCNQALSPGGAGFSVFVARPKVGTPQLTSGNPADFNTDPLTKAPLDWLRKNAEVTSPGGRPCASFFNGTPPAVPQIVPITGVYTDTEYPCCNVNGQPPANLTLWVKNSTFFIPVPAKTHPISAACFMTNVSSEYTGDCGWETCNCWNNTISPGGVTFNFAFAAGLYKSNGFCFDVVKKTKPSGCSMGYIVFTSPN